MGRKSDMPVESLGGQKISSANKRDYKQEKRGILKITMQAGKIEESAERPEQLYQQAREKCLSD